VTAELSKRRVAHELARKRGVDLLIGGPTQTPRSVKVKMKGRASPDWQDHIELTPSAIPRHESMFYVFVDRGETGSGEPRFWIVPYSWMRQDVYLTHRRWLAEVGGVRPNKPGAEHHTIEQPRIDQRRDRWDLLATRP